MNKHLTYTCFLLFFILRNTMVSAQLDEKRFIHYTTNDGLSDNVITGLTQDQKGFIWITTENGLNRFDGMEFKKLFRSAGTGIPIDDIERLSSNKDQLLFITGKGIQSFDVNNERITNYALAETEPGSEFVNNACDALLTNEGDILMSSQTGLYSFSKKGGVNFRYDHYPLAANKQPPGNFGRFIAPLQDHLFVQFAFKDDIFVFDNKLKKYAPVDAYRHRFPNLAAVNRKLSYRTAAIGRYKMLLAADHGRELFFYDGQTDRLQPCSMPAFLGLAAGYKMRWYSLNDTTAILTSSKNGLFICHFNITTGEIRADTTCYFANYLCTAVLKDKEGRLWIGTNKGLLKQDLSEKPVHTIDIRSLLPADSKKENLEIYSFYRHQHELYVGTYSRDGIYVLDATNYTFRQKISFATLNPMCNQIWHILPMAKDTLWFATQYGLVWLHTGNKHFGYVQLPETIQPYISGSAVTIAFKDSHNLLWLQGKWGSGVIQYNAATKQVRIFKMADSANYLPVRGPSHIVEDAANNIWLAARGLTRWNRHTDRFDTVMTSYTGFNKKNPDIFTLTTGQQQQIIFSNRNNGAVLYNPVLKKYDQLTTEQGLPENNIPVILALKNHYVWMASRNYLSAWNQQTNKITSYSYTDGIPPEGGLPLSLYHDTIAKRVLTGYSSNFIGWVTDNLQTGITPRIPFFIDAVSTGNRNIMYPGTVLKLPYNENDIRIHLTAVNFQDEQNNRFWYRTNSREPWVALEKQNTINFNDLTPGKYVLQIKASSVSNRWQEVIQTITVIIQPPFWQTGWFYTLILLLVAAIIYFSVRSHIRNIRRTAELNNMIAVTEMKALHAQMNPHFIFNSLNSISELILQNENDKASQYLVSFARLIRMNLDHARHHFISLGQNIQYLYIYLEIESLRFDDLVYTITVDDNLDTANIDVPPMLLQPLIENAIWHGLKPSRGNKQLNIRFMKQDNQLVCEIEDNGIGLNKAAQQQPSHHSTGIENIKDRIRLLNSKYQINCLLDIEDISEQDHAGSGTRARLTLSLTYE